MANADVKTLQLTKKWGWFGALASSHIWELPMWKVIGIVGTAFTVILAIGNWAVRTRPVNWVHEELVKGGIKLLLGSVKGQMVYEGLRKDFSAYKKTMDYHVSISDTPFQESSLGDQLKKGIGRYYFFRSKLHFKRVQTSAENQDEILIAAITDPDKLGDWIKRPNVIFREVVGINAADKPWLDSVIEDMDHTNDVNEKASNLARFFNVQFYVEGNLAHLVDVRREVNGYSLVYQQPKAAHQDDPMDYSITLWSVQSKDVTSFPFVVSEPTGWVDVKVDYSHANLKNLHYFPAFVVGASQGNPRIDFDQMNKIFQVSSVRQEWLFPGSGFIMYWSTQ